MRGIYSERRSPPDPRIKSVERTIFHTGCGNGAACLLPQWQGNLPPLFPLPPKKFKPNEICVIPRNELNWGWLILTIARWRTPFPTDWRQWKRKPARPTTASRYTLRQEDISSWAKRTMAPTWNFQRYLLLFKLIRISVLTTVFVVAFSQAHKLSWRCLLRSEHAQAIREWMYSFSVVTQRFQVITLNYHHFFV